MVRHMSHLHIVAACGISIVTMLAPAIPGAMRSDAIGSEGLIHALPLLVEIGQQ